MSRGRRLGGGAYDYYHNDHCDYDGYCDDYDDYDDYYSDSYGHSSHHHHSSSRNRGHHQCRCYCQVHHERGCPFYDGNEYEDYGPWYPSNSSGGGSPRSPFFIVVNPNGSSSSSSRSVQPRQSALSSSKSTPSLLSLLFAPSSSKSKPKSKSTTPTSNNTSKSTSNPTNSSLYRTGRAAYDVLESLAKNRYNSEMNSRTESQGNCFWVTLAYLVGTNSLSLAKFLGIKQKGAIIPDHVRTWERKGFKMHLYEFPRVRARPDNPYEATLDPRVYKNIPRTFGVGYDYYIGGRMFGHAVVGKKVGDEKDCRWRMVCYQTTQDGLPIPFDKSGGLTIDAIYWVEPPQSWLDYAKKEREKESRKS